MPKPNKNPKYSQGKSKRNNQNLANLGQGRGRIDRNAFSSVNLRGSKLLLVSLLLSLPYLITIIALYLNGLKFVAIILIVVAIFLILVVSFARWIEKSNL